MWRPWKAFADASRRSSLAALSGLVPHYLAFYWFTTPLLTDAIAAWIMARTPSQYAVVVLAWLGPWSKPLAMTGGLAILGFGVFLVQLAGKGFSRRQGFWAILAMAAGVAVTIAAIFNYRSLPGAMSFWIPAAAIVVFAGRRSGRIMAKPGAPAFVERRQFLAISGKLGLPLVMASGTAAVAIEGYLRNGAIARRAKRPIELFPFQPPLDRSRFANGLVRKATTSLPEFYGMSKNAVDPAVDPAVWRLVISIEGRPIQSYSYAELLSMPRCRRYQTLRCISNTLTSDLMGTAEWAGIRLSQLIDRRSLPQDVIEAAFIGVEGHDDSLALDYAFSEEALLALGMNGKTLSRTHGFPIRLLAPRYYGCRNVKWIREIRFTTKPYFGTWQRLGYTKEPVIHTVSHIDRMIRSASAVRFGGVSFAGNRGIRCVRVRVNRGLWSDATIEPALSQYTWTRWTAEIRARESDWLEVNAQDGAGSWQSLAAGNAFPSGMYGPTLVKVGV